jgi:glutaredoxin
MRIRFSTSNYNRPMHEVVVYSRRGCHLCDVVKQTLTQLEGAVEFEWHEVDIDLNPELLQKYNEEVPVVLIDGRKAFKYRMEPDQFLKVLVGSSRVEHHGRSIISGIDMAGSMA